MALLHCAGATQACCRLLVPKVLESKVLDPKVLSNLETLSAPHSTLYATSLCQNCFIPKLIHCQTITLLSFEYSFFLWATRCCFMQLTGSTSATRVHEMMPTNGRILEFNYLSLAVMQNFEDNSTLMVPVISERTGKSEALSRFIIENFG